MKKISFLSVFIILGVSFATGTVSARLFDSIINYKQNNLQRVAYHSKTCRPVASAFESRNKAILRIDDVQANAWRDVTERMILDANKKGMKTVLGVIPFKLPSDSELFAFLRENRCSTEIALHGWTHGIEGDYNKAEFGDLDKKEAGKKIKKGLRVLRKVTRSEITTFIPPQNQISQGSKEALESMGFKVISSEGGAQHDYTASTYNWKEKKLVPVDEVIQKCSSNFLFGQPCIIMLHPQDYATDDKMDREKYDQYLKLLEEFERRNIEAVTFQEL